MVPSQGTIRGSHQMHPASQPPPGLLFRIAAIMVPNSSCDLDLHAAQSSHRYAEHVDSEGWGQLPGTDVLAGCMGLMSRHHTTSVPSIRLWRFSSVGLPCLFLVQLQLKPVALSSVVQTPVLGNRPLA